MVSYLKIFAIALLSVPATLRAAAPFGYLGVNINDVMMMTQLDYEMTPDHYTSTKPLANNLRASQAIYFPRSALTTIDGLDRAGQASGIGLGWVAIAATPTHPRLIEKTGGGWGFMTYVALAPGRRSGIFVAISSHQMTAMPPLAVRVNDLVGALAR